MYFPIINETHSVLKANTVLDIQHKTNTLTRNNTRDFSIIGSLHSKLLFVEFAPRVTLAEEDMLLQGGSCRDLLLYMLTQVNLDQNNIYITSIIKKFPELLLPTTPEKSVFNSEVIVQQPQIIICMGAEVVKFLFPKVEFPQLQTTPRNLTITAKSEATIFAVPHPLECLQDSQLSQQFITTLQIVKEFISTETTEVIKISKKETQKFAETTPAKQRRHQFSIKEIPIHEDHCALF